MTPILSRSEAVQKFEYYSDTGPALRTGTVVACDCHVIRTVQSRVCPPPMIALIGHVRNWPQRDCPRAQFFSRPINIY